MRWYASRPEPSEKINSKRGKMGKECTKALRQNSLSFSKTSKESSVARKQVKQKKARKASGKVSEVRMSISQQKHYCHLGQDNVVLFPFSIMVLEASNANNTILIMTEKTITYF